MLRLLADPRVGCVSSPFVGSEARSLGSLVESLHILHPEPISDPTLNYIVLGVAALFDGTSFVIALRTLRREAPGQSVMHVVRHGKDPALFTVVLEDFADLAGLAFAFLGVWLGHYFANPYLDGVASIAIGLLLAAVALVLVAQSRSLLIGSRERRRPPRRERGGRGGPEHRVRRLPVEHAARA